MLLIHVPVVDHDRSSSSSIRVRGPRYGDSWQMGRLPSGHPWSISGERRHLPFGWAVAHVPRIVVDPARASVVSVLADFPSQRRLVSFPTPLRRGFVTAKRFQDGGTLLPFTPASNIPGWSQRILHVRIRVIECAKVPRRLGLNRIWQGPMHEQVLQLGASWWWCCGGARSTDI